MHDADDDVHKQAKLLTTYTYTYKDLQGLTRTYLGLTLLTYLDLQGLTYLHLHLQGLNLQGLTLTLTYKDLHLQGLTCTYTYKDLHLHLLLTLTRTYLHLQGLTLLHLQGLTRTYTYLYTYNLQGLTYKDLLTLTTYKDLHLQGKHRCPPGIHKYHVA